MMKKGLLWILILSLLLCCLSGCKSDEYHSSEPVSEPVSESTEEPTIPLSARYQVAMITDYGEITDMSYNQVTFEAGRDWCQEYGIPYAYYRPTEDYLEARIAAIEQAILEGANVLLLPGYSFGSAIAETAEKYPEVYYIALDVGAADLGEGYKIPPNVFCATYHEEVAGFLAGYAAVNMGYKDLAFVGSIAVPAVMRYGYGFIQGADYAAEETGAEVSVRYGYGLQCFCDAGYHGIRSYVDTWFKEGLDGVFFCGGDIYTYLEDMDRPYDLKIIGVDTDLKGILDDLYGEGTALTSAMKNFSATIGWALSELILEEHWDSLGGTIATLGLVSSTDLEKNHVTLPDSTQWNDCFTREDYASIVEAIYTGAVTVDPSIEQNPSTDHITVDWLGNLYWEH